MAVISPAEDALVVRIVYDGPPMAGKTTSLRTLAAQLGRELHTPAEIDGRTLFFDWLDYTGGVFEGRRIRCQIVTVPGQSQLVARRNALLQSADAVVFVADTTRDGLAQALHSLHAAREILDTRTEPPVGIILQANKRDHSDAVPLEELRATLDMPARQLSIVESVATDGAGIREAFVYAVRLALERVSAISKCAPLATMRPVIDSPAELLEALLRSDANTAESSTLAELSGPQTTELGTLSNQTSDPGAPRLDGSVQRRWPTGDGDSMWREATAERPALQRRANGDWCGSSKGWQIRSPAAGCFPDRAAAERALHEWAQAHETHHERLIGRRCLIVTNTRDGHYRLWQCISTTSTLRSQLEHTSHLDAASLLKALTGAARALVRACSQWKDVAILSARLDTIAATPHGPRYAAPLPYPCVADTARIEDLSTLLRAEFAFLRERLLEHQDALQAAVAERARLQPQPATRPDAAAALLELLLQT